MLLKSCALSTEERERERKKERIYLFMHIQIEWVPYMDGTFVFFVQS